MTKRFDPDSITNEILIDELVKLANTLGHTPSRSEMKNGNNITKRLYLYGRRFGGLSKACEIAGLKINLGGIDIKYTDDEMLKYIIEFGKRLGKTPTQEDINKDGKYAIGAYKRHFGTYNNALKLVDIQNNTAFNCTCDEIKSDIIRVASEVGRSPTIKEFNERTKTVSSSTACKSLNGRYSWNNVLNKCGLKVINNRNITDHELKCEIDRLNKQLGRIPGYYDMVQLGIYSAETYALRYGTYLKALEHFGYEYVSDNQWQNQTYTTGKDGYLYKSKFEANIANCLYDLLIKCKILKYDYEKEVCAERKWTCDFYVKTEHKSYWLEADGMGKNRFDPYSNNNEKIKYYQDHCYNYIIVPYRKVYIDKHIFDLLFLDQNSVPSTKLQQKDNI